MRRLRTDTLLKSAQRTKILGLLRKFHGAHVARIAREADLSWTAAAHHLRELEAAAFVTSRRVGRRRVYAARDTHANALAILGGRTAQRVAMALVEHSGGTIFELATAISLSRRALHYHVLRMRRVGLVVVKDEATRTRGDQTPIRVQPTPLLIHLMNAP